MKNQLDPIAVHCVAALAFTMIAQADPAGGRVTDESDSPYSGGISEREFLFGDPGGQRTALAENGIRLEATLLTDTSRVFEGGADADFSAFRHLFEAEIVVETEPLAGIKGGELLILFANQKGRNASERLGDFQVFSNIDEVDFTAIYELYYQQMLFGERLRIKLGKVDANGEFAYVEHGAGFLNSSPGFSPTILSFPTYPDPATSINVFLHPTDRTYAGFGLYDGALQEGIGTGTRGPSTFFGSPADLFLIGEAGLIYGESGLPGRIGLGVWRHTGTFERFDGDSEDGTTGFYLVADQTVYRPNPDHSDDERGIGLFAQYGWADPDVSEVDHHFGLGAQWTGPFPGRGDDVAGLMASYVHFSDRPGAGFADDGELAVELYYRARGAPWFYITPDLQYIANPGGAGLPDAWVGTVRTEVAF